MNKPNQIAIDAADKICNWLQADDDPITTQERMKCAEIIQSAIEKATEPLVNFAKGVRDSYVMITNTEAIIKAHRKNVNDAYTVLKPESRADLPKTGEPETPNPLCESHRAAYDLAGSKSCPICDLIDKYRKTLICDATWESVSRAATTGEPYIGLGVDGTDLPQPKTGEQDKKDFETL